MCTVLTPVCFFFISRPSVHHMNENFLVTIMKHGAFEQSLNVTGTRDSMSERILITVVHRSEDRLFHLYLLSSSLYTRQYI